MTRPSNKVIGGVVVGIFSVLLLATAGWTVADETQQCFKLRYGEIVDDNVDSGLQPEWWIYDFECLPMTEQQIPNVGENDSEWITVSFETADRMNTSVPFRAVVRYNPGSVRDVFLAKRTQEAIIADVKSGLITGAAQAGNSLTLDDIFDGGLETLQARMHESMQDEVGSLADVVRVFVQQPAMPPSIRQARNDARQQEEQIRQIRQEFVADSVRGEKDLIQALLAADATRARAQAYADSVQLTLEAEARAFSTNRSLAELRATEAQSRALENLLTNCTNNCIVGSDVLNGALASMMRGGN